MGTAKMKYTNFIYLKHLFQTTKYVIQRAYDIQLLKLLIDFKVNYFKLVSFIKESKRATKYQPIASVCVKAVFK